MITIRRADERGRTDYGGWLDSRHSFSFGDYYDPDAMGFRSLRVLNDDRVVGGGGFPTHPHQDMEILSYVIDGGLAHKDSTGGGGVIRPGEIQFMRAGTGVRHSEFNHSNTEPVHFLQIWIVPDRRGLPPAYGQNAFDVRAATTAPVLLASRDGRLGTHHISQDVDLWVSRVPADRIHTLEIEPGRQAWVQIAEGEVEVNGRRLTAGDGAAVSEETLLALTGRGEMNNVLIFDLA
jgi:redox-sensitive bicupin YhaK (pirin superfamily)